MPGSATIEWLDDAFVVFRWTMGGDVGTATSEMVLVLGRSDAGDMYTALYHDDRGVWRVCAMTCGPDRIGGGWQASEDRGSAWRKEFDLIFERV